MRKAMKKKIFKYFACMITVAILATTLLLSWVNYEMFKGDYAHKPDALEKVLQSAKSFAKGRVLIIFLLCDLTL